MSLSGVKRPGLGLGSGAGLVVANMVGAGGFLSFGFMAQDLGPGPILLAWVVGMVLALAGSLAYAGVAELVPRSGGEYRYLADLLHPAVGYVAGWASMLLGFAGPVAIDALAAGAFANTLFGALEPRSWGVLIIVCVTSLHLVDLRVSQLGQNALVVLKIVLVVGFVVLGLAFGRRDWPDWHPLESGAGFSLEPFMASLFYIGFAFSGWNAAVYAAGEFRDPRRDVPRAMLLGCAAVGLFYLTVNWIFIVNLTPERARVVFEYETSRITLAHLIIQDALGDVAGKLTSGMMLVALVSATSAMTFAGPRVYAAMAEDGLLPRALQPRQGKPPVGSVLLQAVLSIVILFAQPFQHLMHDVSAVLTLFSALTALTLFRARFTQGIAIPPLRLGAAAVYTGLAAWMLYYGFRAKTQLLIWLTLVAAIAGACYAISRARAAR